MKKSVILIGLLALVLLFSSQIVSARVFEEWVAIYQKPESISNRPVDIVVDDDGNVYVTGYTKGNDVSSTYDYLTLKYDMDGDLVWAEVYNGAGNGKDTTAGIALDASGNAYVTGSSDTGDTIDYVTIKYNPADGSVAWTNIYAITPVRNLSASGIAVDAEGNSHVTGYSIPDIGWDYDYITIKCDPNGNLKWDSYFNGENSDFDQAYYIALDDSGNVIVTGSSRKYDNKEIITVKYDQYGNEEWVHRKESSSNDRPRDITVDTEGYIYIAGYRDLGNDGDRFITARIKNTGRLSWIDDYYNPIYRSSDVATGIALDGLGYVYVTGRVEKDSYDYMTIKYNVTSPEREWVRTYDGESNGGDGGIDIAVDGLGNSYVTGNTTNIDEDLELTTLKYDTSGNLKRTMIFDHPGIENGMAEAITMDDDGIAYATGTGETADGDSVIIVIKYVDSNCFIDGVSYQFGDVNPENICLICDGDRSADSWSDNDGAACDDGLFCTDPDQCSGGSCSDVPDRDCDDSVDCTDDSCNEVTNSCENVANDANCLNGPWCNGIQTCDTVDDCQPGASPCDDGVDCTQDTCHESTDSCSHAPIDALCDNGQWCDGAETCDPVSDCQPGTAPDCNDNVACTDDSCNESNDTCANVANDANCDDSLWCNGDEVCHEVRGCETGPPRDCSAFADDCNWAECDEDGNYCYSEPKAKGLDLDCDDGLFCTVNNQCAAGVCSEGEPNLCNDNVNCTDDSCDEVGDTCVNTPKDTLCDNGDWCDGTETCDVVSDCQPGTAPDCNDNVTCTDDSCDEAGDACVNQANDANCDDNAWCNGSETCDPVTGCQPDTDPCDPVTQVCNETDDVCEPGDPIFLTVTVRLHGSWNGTVHNCESLVRIDLYDELMVLIDSFFDITLTIEGTAQVDLLPVGLTPGNYYVVLRHLNHVDLKTILPVTWDGANPITVDFTNPAKVECGAAALFNMSGVWTMPAGDIDPDSRVALSDFNYLRTHWTETDPACDLDCDGYCRLGDFNKLRQTWNMQGCAP